MKHLPLTLSLTFAFKDTWDTDKIREVARWLNQDYYKPFYVTDNPNRIYYCMLESDSRLLHNGLKQGYVTVTMRCDGPYTYSSEYVSSEYICSGTTAIPFVNHGDVVCKPEIWIKKTVGSGDASIVNQTNGNKEFKFTGLVLDETVYVDNENEYIETDIPQTYRYNNFNNTYLELVRGSNTLNVTGDCVIQFRYKFKTLQG